MNMYRVDYIKPENPESQPWRFGSRSDYFERRNDIIATHRCGGILNAPMWLSPIVKQTGITFLLGNIDTESNKVEIGSRINENLQIYILRSTIQVLGTVFL